MPWRRPEGTTLSVKWHIPVSAGQFGHHSRTVSPLIEISTTEIAAARIGGGR